MCGILGAIYFKGQKADARSLLQAAQWMSHRGPDDEGVWTKDSVGFAHKRLSILDLSSAGHQPMVSADGSGVIVYNGECYNFQDLRTDLEARGYRFRSRTDTEVILYGVQEYGPAFVTRMNGGFAFGIWSDRTRELLLVRDRLGVKPLYVYRDADKLYFASEIKPLLGLGVAPRLEEEAVSSYFAVRYCPGERTLFKDIRKLSPGHYLRVRQDGEVEDHAYWALTDLAEISDISFGKAKAKFFDLLDSAVGLRQIADVPVGAFLSGGIDSGAVVALMKKKEAAVESFTIGMGADIDETQEARRVAEFVGVRNEAFALQKDDYRFYEKAVWHLEEPIGDSIIAPTYLLAQRAARRLKVIELGEGADEILGGYVHQLAMTYGEILKSRLPFVASRLIPWLAKALPQGVWEKVFPYPAKLGASGPKRVMEYLKHTGDPARSYLDLAEVFGREGQKEIFSEEFFKDSVEGHGPYGAFSEFFSRSANPVFQNRLLALDLRYWNADYSLVRMDKLTMAHSLEARVPYLDYRLVEFCLGLPRKFKTRNFVQKVLLREALKGKDLLPQETIRAPKKAFYLPIEKCFDDRFEGYMKDILSSESFRHRKMFNAKHIEGLFGRSQRELVGNKQVMALIIFELWARAFLDGHWKDQGAGGMSPDRPEPPGDGLLRERRAGRS